MSRNHQYYEGRGKTIAERDVPLPPSQKAVAFEDPSHYVAGEGLRNAVNVALMLGQPLFVTGEPGTGKTQLAWSVAHELMLNGPLVFNTKTTSAARDLFYRYDALRHFHDANLRRDGAKAPDPEDYITYEALGLAILLSQPPGPGRPRQQDWMNDLGPLRSVVLIDEIDKAPRDFPNDILFEIDALSFKVPETGRSFRVYEDKRPIIILTSNSEKNLPDAFLRRCVFYNIPFPSKEQLVTIVRGRLNLSERFSEKMLEDAIEHFEHIRSLYIKKKPATAELLAWLKVLDARNIDVSNLQPGDAEVLALTYSVLAKNPDDLAVITNSTLPQ